MTKEELEATNKKISDECHKLVGTLEKKQKESAELKKENKVLAQNLEDTEICENGWKNRVKELKAQIEKMKCCVVSCCESCERLPKLYKEFENGNKEM